MNKFILVPNASNPKNIGDLAALAGLISKIPSNKLKVHGVNPFSYEEFFKNEFSLTLYSWAVFINRNPFSRTTRVIQLILAYITLKYFKKTLFVSKELKSLINDYKNADMILFVGGGYLRSQRGITQALNLLMTLLMFQFAQLANAKKIVAPISFGPFAYRWQEKYSANILKDFDLTAAREIYSFELLKKYKINNLILSSDTSFLLDFKNKIKRADDKDFVLGFTIRKWLKNDLQKQFEKEFTQAIISFSKSTGAIIQPIVQVDAPNYGDYDASLTEIITRNLKSEGIIVKPVKKIKDLEDSAKIYSEIDLLLGMRMHSNILAAIQGIPFVAISYEYKTEGIAKGLGVEEYCIKVEDINSQNLYELLIKAYKNQVYLKETIKTSLERIRKEETSRWSKILQNYL